MVYHGGIPRTGRKAIRSASLEKKRDIIHLVEGRISPIQQVEKVGSKKKGALS